MSPGPRDKSERKGSFAMAMDDKHRGTCVSILRAIRRWLLRGVLAVLALLILTAAVSAIYESIARISDEKRFPAPGRLVDIGTHRLHINCMGQGSPTVILDAGAGMWSTSWWWVQHDLAATTRVCSYDRTGMGWSDPGPGPGSLDGIQTVKELHLLLEKAGERGPFVYVGHSLGGMLARIYYQQYPNDLVGMVLVEPGDPQLLLVVNPSLQRTDIRPCGRLCTIGRIAARLGIARVLVQHNKLVNDPKFPPEALAEWKARVVLPAVLTSVLTLGKYLGAICRETLENKSLGDLPVVLIRGTEFAPPFFVTGSEQEQREAVRKVLDGWAAIAKLSSKGQAPVVIEGANHLTLIAYKEYADQVSAVIRGMVQKTRPGANSRQSYCISRGN
jgi:pimeloyl-ACP methyl ester carboxylesterase